MAEQFATIDGGGTFETNRVNGNSQLTENLLNLKKELQDIVATDQKLTKRIKDLRIEHSYTRIQRIQPAAVAR